MAIPSLVDALVDPRDLQSLAARLWDFMLPLDGAEKCLKEHKREIALILEMQNTPGRHYCWAGESTVSGWLRRCAVVYRSKHEPSERPKANPRRVNYPLSDGAKVLYKITTHAVARHHAGVGPSFDDAVRALEDRRAALEWNEIIG